MCTLINWTRPGEDCWKKSGSIRDSDERGTRNPYVDMVMDVFGDLMNDNFVSLASKVFVVSL